MWITSVSAFTSVGTWKSCAPSCAAAFVAKSWIVKSSILRTYRSAGEENPLTTLEFPLLS